MAIRTFRIPVSHGESTESDLNAFLKSHRVVSVDRHFVANGELSFWAFAVEYLESSAAGKKDASAASAHRNRIDYREVLKPEEFEVFARLRDVRKQIAQEDAVPIYMVFTNEQLAQVVRRGVTTKSQLGQIDGVGESRIEKYGERMLASLSETDSSAASLETDGGLPPGRSSGKSAGWSIPGTDRLPVRPTLLRDRQNSVSSRPVLVARPWCRTLRAAFFCCSRKRRARTHGLTVSTAAVPLRQSAAGCRAENANPHDALAPWTVCRRTGFHPVWTGYKPVLRHLLAEHPYAESSRRVSGAAVTTSGGVRVTVSEPSSALA
jgi:hypothetical protein